VGLLGNAVGTLNSLIAGAGLAAAALLRSGVVSSSWGRSAAEEVS